MNKLIVNTEDIIIFSDFTYWVDGDLKNDKGNIVFYRKSKTRPFVCKSHGLYDFLDIIFEHRLEIIDESEKKYMKKFINLIHLQFKA